MLNNYTRGGQVFLHKLRMFSQVWSRSFVISCVLAIVITFAVHFETISSLDYPAGITYIKAHTKNYLDKAFNNKQISEIKAINNQRRIWIIIDELPALKKLPSLPTALSEFRKYGGCILAGIQSINQLYKIYGQA